MNEVNVHMDRMWPWDQQLYIGACGLFLAFQLSPRREWTGRLGLVFPALISTLFSRSLLALSQNAAILFSLEEPFSCKLHFWHRAVDGNRESKYVFCTCLRVSKFEHFCMAVLLCSDSRCSLPMPFNLGSHQ